MPPLGMAARSGWTSTTPMRTGMALLGELIEVRSSDIQECHNRSPVPKMRFYADHHFSAINGLARGADGRLRFQPLKLFLTPTMLVTVLGPTSSSLTSEIARRELAAVRQRIDSGQLRPASSFELVGAIRAEEMRTHENLITESSARIATAGTRRLTEGSGESRSAVARPVRSPPRPRSDPYQCRPGRRVVREPDRDHGPAGRTDADGPAPGCETRSRASVTCSTRLISSANTCRN